METTGSLGPAIRLESKSRTLIFLRSDPREPMTTFRPKSLFIRARASDRRLSCRFARCDEFGSGLIDRPVPSRRVSSVPNDLYFDEALGRILCSRASKDKFLN